MTDILERRPLPTPTAPRVPEIRPVSGRLTRLGGYVLMAFAAAVSSGPPPDFSRSREALSLARAVCRDPDPGVVGPVLERIDGLLAAAEQILEGAGPDPRMGFGLLIGASMIAATEPLTLTDPRN